MYTWHIKKKKNGNIKFAGRQGQLAALAVLAALAARHSLSERLKTTKTCSHYNRVSWNKSAPGVLPAQCSWTRQLRPPSSIFSRTCRGLARTDRALHWSNARHCPPCRGGAPLPFRRSLVRDWIPRRSTQNSLEFKFVGNGYDPKSFPNDAASCSSRVGLQGWFGACLLP